MRFLLLAALFMVVRRVVVGMFSRSGSGGRVGSERPRRRAERDSTEKRPDEDLGAGQRIEEAEFEELD